MNRYYELFPKVSPLNRKHTFCLEPQPAADVFKGVRRFGISIISAATLDHHVEKKVEADSTGKVFFEFSAPVAGEYCIALYRAENETDKEPVFLTGFFSLPDNLLKLIPFKGDWHIHTNYSDGTESPVCMAAKARMAGLDYAAITDHNCFKASIEAFEEAQKYNIDLLLFTGEEVTYKNGYGHVISINAKKGICEDILPREIWSDIPDAALDEIVDDFCSGFLPQVEKLKKVPGLDMKKYAYLHGIIKKIHELGGLAVLAHPFWKQSGVLNLTRPCYEQMLYNGAVDAIELFGDVNIEENICSFARLQTALTTLYAGPNFSPSKGATRYAGPSFSPSKGATRYAGPSFSPSKGATESGYPVVGNSDAHRGDNHTLGRTWTVAFAEKLDRAAIIDAVLNQRTAACTTAASGEVIIAGPFHFVEYAYFLQREFFPFHDEICKALGKHYLNVLRGGLESGDKKNALLRSLRDYYKKCFLTNYSDFSLQNISKEF
ncbi:MAG: PHP domain-containing protein [Spirochaetota bacterium]